MAFKHEVGSNIEMKTERSSESREWLVQIGDGTHKFEYRFSKHESERATVEQVALTRFYGRITTIEQQRSEIHRLICQYKVELRSLGLNGNTEYLHKALGLL